MSLDKNVWDYYFSRPKPTGTAMDETIGQMYAAILAAPADTTARLVYADALDERNAVGDAERATFIRNHIALEALGPPRVSVFSDLKKQGNGYYSVTVSEDEADGTQEAMVKAGDRIDVQYFVGGIQGPGGPRRGKVKTKHGLVVSRVLPDDPASGTRILALKEDEFSVPWPAEEANRLAKACHDTFFPWGRHWMPTQMSGAAQKTHMAEYPDIALTMEWSLHQTHIGAPINRPHWTLGFRRGFPAVLSGGVLQVRQWLTWMTQTFPIEHVHFWSSPRSGVLTESDFSPIPEIHSWDHLKKAYPTVGKWTMAGGLN